MTSHHDAELVAAAKAVSGSIGHPAHGAKMTPFVLGLRAGLSAYETQRTRSALETLCAQAAAFVQAFGKPHPVSRVPIPRLLCAIEAYRAQPA